ncbi:MAG: hypothetical protein B7Y47_03010 [Sphingomonas sp. 28-63-12]|nr:MAG: hypothetical protein B7Y47_03010 [Sphingomonas sp. 28-63-12]
MQPSVIDFEQVGGTVAVGAALAAPAAKIATASAPVINNVFMGGVLSLITGHVLTQPMPLILCQWPANVTLMIGHKPAITN